jgi:hypothetical protein
MTRFFTCATVVICLGTTATLATIPGQSKTVSGASTRQRNEALFAADGAFRDGLYLGQLAAAHGQPQRLAIGRWSAGKDRAMFAAGYHRGYGESLVDANAGIERVEPTE